MNDCVDLPRFLSLLWDKDRIYAAERTASTEMGMCYFIPKPDRKEHPDPQDICTIRIRISFSDVSNFL